MIAKMDVKGMLADAADYSRFLDAYAFLRRKLTRSQIIILMYHRISPMRDIWSLKPLNPRSFELQIRYFCRNYDILPLDTLVEYIKHDERLPEKAVVITFDDGYKDNYRYAYPILKKYHIPATIFLTTGHIGKGNLFWWDKVSYIILHTDVGQLDVEELGIFSLQSERERYNASSIIIERFKMLSGEKKDLLINNLLNKSGVEIPDDLGEDLVLSWDEIREMSQGGIAFGAHTVNHPILINISLEQAKREIVQSKNDIETMIGRQVTSFSYPNGDFNADVAELVRGSGFACAVAVSPNRLIRPRDFVYGLSRIGMNEDFSKSKVMLCGLWMDLKTVMQK